MKKMVSMIAVAVLVSNLSMANTSGDKKSVKINTKPSLEVELEQVVSKEREGLRLIVQNIDEKEVQINLKDEFGRVIFTQTVRDMKSFNKNFIMDQLESGKYTFEISTPNRYISKTVAIQK